MTLVGEMGPEMVNLPAGSSVLPSWQTAGIMHGGDGGGGDGDGTIHFSHQSNVVVNGRVLGSTMRSESLTFNRRNPSNNLSLGRGRRS
jgi:hypothetical protein